MWAAIEGYENYEVSNNGDVRNIKTGKNLSPRLDKDGYGTVHLYSKGKGLNHRIHRLVAKAFLPQDDIRTQVNHKNGDKEDNRIENLEWCTRSENTKHAYKNRLFEANIKPAIIAHTKISKDDQRDILELRDNGLSVKDIARIYDVSLTTIYEICKRRC